MNDIWQMDIFYLNIQNETISALHIIDCFSGFGLAYVLNKKTANSITECIINFAMYMGKFPRRLFMDSEAT